MRGKEEMILGYSKWLFVEENASLGPNVLVYEEKYKFLKSSYM